MFTQHTKLQSLIHGGLLSKVIEFQHVFQAKPCQVKMALFVICFWNKYIHQHVLGMCRHVHIYTCTFTNIETTCTCACFPLINPQHSEVLHLKKIVQYDCKSISENVTEFAVYTCACACIINSEVQIKKMIRHNHDNGH